VKFSGNLAIHVMGL